MHQLIYGLVRAESPNEGLERAKHEIFQSLVDDKVFDYYVTFDEDGQGVAGRDRWGDIPAAVAASTDDGRQRIDRAWDATVEAYWQSFKRVDEFLDAYDPSDYWTDENVYRQYQFDFNRIGELHGPGTYLYDQDGQGIRHKAHLRRVENAWGDILDGDDPYEDLSLYVVPADVHY